MMGMKIYKSAAAAVAAAILTSFLTGAVYADYNKGAEYTGKSGAELAEEWLARTERAELAEENIEENANIPEMSGSCGENMSWVLDEDGNLVISGKGIMTSGWKGDLRIKSVVICEGVGSVCESAFYGCENLEGVIIPQTAASIGNRAFYGCKSLSSVFMGSKIKIIGSEAFCGCGMLERLDLSPEISVIEPSLFRDCTSLRTVNIPENVTGISENAFENCISLKQITIPRNIAYISASAFDGCTGLAEIDADGGNEYYSSADGVLFGKDGTELIKYPAAKSGAVYSIGAETTSIAEHAFKNSANLEEAILHSGISQIGNEAFRGASVKRISLPEGLTTMGLYVFADCRELTDAEFSCGIGNISSGMFYGCTELENIVITEGIKEIGDYAFAYCTSLSRLVMFDGIERIGAAAFRGCAKLSEIDIPDSVSEIADFAFYECTGIKSINTGAENQNYTDEEGVLFTKDKTRLIKYPPKKTGAEYTVPDETEIIGYGAFEDCEMLEEITFSKTSSLTAVEDEAFCRCVSIGRIELPKGTLSIGRRAFRGCTNLHSLDMSSTLKEIGDSAFDNCVNLEYVDIPESTVSIGKAVFYNCIRLYDIAVANKNKNYKSENGILFNKNQTELIQYPADKWDTEYIIPEKVTSIDWYAFYKCTELEYVSIPKKVSSIGYEAFYGCVKLSDIYVDEENEFYTSVEGVLYDKPVSCLIQYPPGRGDENVYEIPEGVESIWPYAFCNGTNLEEIIIPESMTEINSGAMYKCTSLSALTIPAGVRNIGERVFDSCINLTDIVYGGTMKEWTQISAGCNMRNINVHCSDGEIKAKPVIKQIVTEYDGILLSAEKNNGEITVTVTGENPSVSANLKVYAAVYDDDDNFIDAYILNREYLGGEIIYRHNLTLAGNIKLMVWDKNMTPLILKTEIY